MKALSFGNHIAKFGSHGISAGVVNPTYHVKLIESISGTVCADPMKGRQGTIITLTNAPAEGYVFDIYSLTGAELTGNTFAIQNSDVSAEGVWGYDAFPITYEDDGHGTVTGPERAVPGSTVEISSEYDTYYRLSGYEVTGGTIEGNTLTVTGPCTVRAVFKPNAFTATGNWEKGSNIAISIAKTYGTTANVPMKYAIFGAATGDVPTAWYNTSNRWKVTTTPSAYQITLHPIAKWVFANDNSCLTKTTACSYVGNTSSQSALFSKSNAGTQVMTYDKTFTSNVTGVNYGISAKMYTDGYNYGGRDWYGHNTYSANQTTGTWTATGYAP